MVDNNDPLARAIRFGAKFAGGPEAIKQLIHNEPVCKYALVATDQATPDKITAHFACSACGLRQSIPFDIGACATCNGRGGTLSGEMQGEPPMTAYVEWFAPCDDCLANGLCPGCSVNTVIVGAMDDISAFICPLCGWYFDHGRFYDDEPNYWPDDDGSDGWANFNGEADVDLV